jgi:hypothetical protein
MRAKVVFHRGFHFRSITEARWAVFFEYLNVSYEYEKETFKLEDGLYYLPDFWLPKQKVWIEIKGQPPKEEEKYKAVKLYAVTGKKVYILAGFPDVMRFSDPLEITDYVDEICNFGTYVVDEVNPHACVPIRTGAANISMMHVLGMSDPDMEIQEFRNITDRFNNAAIQGKEKSFHWVWVDDD